MTCGEVVRRSGQAPRDEPDFLPCFGGAWSKPVPFSHSLGVSLLQAIPPELSVAERTKWTTAWRLMPER